MTTFIRDGKLVSIRKGGKVKFQWSFMENGPKTIYEGKYEGRDENLPELLTVWVDNFEGKGRRLVSVETRFVIIPTTYMKIVQRSMGCQASGCYVYEQSKTNLVEVGLKYPSGDTHPAFYVLCSKHRDEMMKQTELETRGRKGVFHPKVEYVK